MIDRSDIPVVRCESSMRSDIRWAVVLILVDGFTASQSSYLLSTLCAVSRALPHPAPRKLHTSPLATFCFLCSGSIARRQVLEADVLVQGGNAGWTRGDDRREYLKGMS